MKFGFKRLGAYCVLALFAVPTWAAEPPAVAKAEIAHLFSYLEKSGCKFNRNGTWYEPKEAVAHLNQKYQNLLDKGWVTSTDVFIEKAATQSSMSGKPYQVQCGTASAQPSADWFRAELSQFRKAKP